MKRLVRQFRWLGFFAISLSLFTSVFTINASEHEGVAENNPVIWSKNYGNGRMVDFTSTNDGGFIFAVDNRSPDVMTFLKIDSDGNIEFNRTFESIKLEHGYSSKILEIPYGEGFIIGSSRSIIKIDSLWNVEWNQTFGDGSWGPIKSLSWSHDGNILAFGHESWGSVWGGLRSWVVKITTDGNLLWEYGAPEVTWTLFLTEYLETSEDGILLVGGTYEGNVFYQKLDTFGLEEWNYTHSTIASAHSIVKVSDGGIITTGMVNGMYWAMKINESGNIGWEKTYAQSSTSSNIIYEVPLLADGFMFCGNYFLDDMTIEGYLVKNDIKGELVWKADLTNVSGVTKVIHDMNGGFTALGSETSDEGDIALIIRIDSIGTVQQKISITQNELRNPTDLIQAKDGNYVVTNASTGSIGQIDILKINLLAKNSEDTLHLQISPITLAILTVLAVSSVGVVYLIRSNSTGNLLAINPKMNKVISDLFKSQTSLYFILQGQNRLPDKKIEEEIRRSVPHKIYEFKYLLQPVRLSIAKILHENIELSSTEIKTHLEISWNDYYNNINSMVKKGYVNITEKFVEGRKQQFVSLNAFGIKEYKILTDLLHLFLDNTSEYRTYIEELDDFDNDSDSKIYPKG